MSLALLPEKDFFRVRFTDVLELVRSRKVFVQAGFAYIPSSEFVAVMSSVYRASLGQALMVCSAVTVLVLYNFPAISCNDFMNVYAFFP